MKEKEFVENKLAIKNKDNMHFPTRSMFKSKPFPCCFSFNVYVCMCAYAYFIKFK